MNTGLCRTSIPRKGWYLIDSRDEGEDNMILCQWCASQHVRYVHIMKHADHEAIEVGCVCAETISEDYNGKATEKELKKRAKLARRLPINLLMEGLTMVGSCKDYDTLIKIAGWSKKSFRAERLRIINERIITRTTS